VSSAYNGCSQGSLSVIVNANNQITTDTYDAAGNLWVIPGTGGATYLYNAENQMTSTSNSSMNYIYDGDGNRVEKSGSKIYWMAGSEVLDETDTTGSVTNSSFNEYVFFGSNRIARRDSSGDVFYYLVDQIDSSRVIAEVPSGQTTATMCYDGDFEPYGGEHAYTNTCSQNYKFTGKERDSESDLDNFGARYYASTTGRFMTPDWAARPTTIPYAVFGDPQSLNLYGYVRNDPVTRADADGHCGEDACVVEGTAALITYTALVGTYYLSQPATQRSLAGASHAAVDKIESWFSKAKPQPKPGSADPDKAGKPFDKPTKDAAREESGDKCVFCGKDTTRTPGPDQSNIDHSVPRSRGGDNTIDNAQNTCRTCNLDKGTKTTEEYTQQNQSNATGTQQQSQSPPQGPQAPDSCTTAGSGQVLCSQDSGGQVIVPKVEDHGPH
jgi:RHS repeat-associated protein